MARSIKDIKLEITTAFITNATVISIYGLNPLHTFEEEFSLVSLENLLFNAIAFCIFSLEKLMDLFRSDVEERIASTRPHTKSWYREKALAFLFGFELGETDIYDTTGFTDDVVAAAKIVSNAAAIKTVISGAGALRIKAVRTVANELQPLTAPQLIALSEYMNLVSDAGTTVLCTSGAADDLKLNLDIYYDALVLGADGSRLDGTDLEPVKTAIKDHLKSLKFNGSFVSTYLTDDLQKVSGVILPVIKEARSKFAAYTYTDTANGVGLINEVRVADAGYMKLDETVLEINYIAFTE